MPRAPLSPYTSNAGRTWQLDQIMSLKLRQHVCMLRMCSNQRILAGLEAIDAQSDGKKRPLGP